MNLKRIKLLAFILIISACTATPNGNTQQMEFHPPLVYNKWETQHFTDSSGGKSCTISSGYNGMEVTIHSSYIAVGSGQKLTPGELFTINVGSHHYQTSGIFTGKQAEKIVEDLSKNDKAYLEWSEVDIFNHRRRHWTNIVKLQDFKQQFDSCLGYVGY